MADIIQSAKSVADTVTGFLGHHITDLNSVASVLEELANVAPIDAQDKARIVSVVDTVRSSANNINDFLNNHTVESGGEVVVKESDLVAAVANFFASDAGKEALANAAKGNANG